MRMLDDAGRLVVDGIRRTAPEWAARHAARILDAWGGHPAEERQRVVAEARRAGEVAAQRVIAELAALFALDPEAQRATPLQLARTLYREPTDVLRRAGVPPVVRDDFAEHAWPDDLYGLVPDTFADLGDDDLTPLHLAWGVAKATVVKARRSSR